MRSALLFVSVTTLIALTGCPGETPADAGSAVDDAGASEDDAGNTEEDAGASDADAGSAVEDAGSTTDDAGVSSEAICSFNDDCPESERCECDESTGCRCLIGERGTGVNGVDRCDVGEDCESALCLEGPGGEYYCSGECTTSDDCTGSLPICSDIAFVGRVCIRDPNAG